MGLKSAFPSVFATASGGRSEETEEEDLRRHLSHHHHHHHRHHHNPLASTDELVTGPIPPVRPLRAQQQQQLHWATSSTNVTPGYVVSASSASVSSSQWSEFTASSSTVVQQTSHQVWYLNKRASRGAHERITNYATPSIVLLSSCPCLSLCC